MSSFPYCTRNALFAIVGPTGAGKSDWALRIAKQLDGEIVNCDSMQIYQGFDIGTAKPSRAERRAVPHHLFDIAHPTEIYSAGTYAKDAKAVIRAIAGRNRVPILVGGTGFYLRALLNGLPDLPPRNECLRARLQTKPNLHKLLARLDPATAARLHPNDTLRLTRALEIRLLAGQAAPALQVDNGLTGFKVRKLALLPPRAELYARLDIRTEHMFRCGLLEEVQTLLSNGIPPTAKPFEAVGYRQAMAVLHARCTVAQAIADAQQATRNYAKRQMTWFRNDAGTELILNFGNAAEIPSIETV